MAFDPIMMSQLGKVPKKLSDEVAEILGTCSQPLNVQEIYLLSAIAVTSRDVSLELISMKKAGLAEIAESRVRPGFRAVGFWRLTDKARAEYSQILEKVSKKAA